MDERVMDVRMAQWKKILEQGDKLRPFRLLQSAASCMIVKIKDKRNGVTYGVFLTFIFAVRVPLAFLLLLFYFNPLH